MQEDAKENAIQYSHTVWEAILIGVTKKFANNKRLLINDALCNRDSDNSFSVPSVFHIGPGGIGHYRAVLIVEPCT